MGQAGPVPTLQSDAPAAAVSCPVLLPYKKLFFSSRSFRHVLNAVLTESDLLASQAVSP